MEPTPGATAGGKAGKAGGAQPPGQRRVRGFALWRQQFGALLRKNYLLALRGWPATALRLLSPFFFMIVIYGVEQSYQVQVEGSDDVRPLATPPRISVSGAPLDARAQIPATALSRLPSSLPLLMTPPSARRPARLPRGRVGRRIGVLRLHLHACRSIWGQEGVPACIVQMHRVLLLFPHIQRWPSLTRSPLG